MEKRLQAFFLENPSILPALSVLLGLCFATSMCSAFPLVLGSLFFIKRRSPFKLLTYLILSLLAYFYGIGTQEHFPKNTSSITGWGEFHLKSIQEHKTHFAKTHICRGVFSFFTDEEGHKAKRISCSFSLSPKEFPLKTDRFYIHGTLKKEHSRSIFSPSSDIPLQKIRQIAGCLPEIRFSCKKFLSKKMKKFYPHPRTHSFFSAVILGENNNSLLRHSFGRIGLQHILAISGFHFGLLSLFMGRLFRLFLPEKASAILLFLTLSFYFLLLGDSPSITRAYLAITLYLLSILCERQTKPINLFGIVLLLELLLSPQNISHLGFQLSFLATGSILLLYRTTLSWVEKFLPPRSKETLRNFPVKDRLLYPIINFLRSTLAVNLAVHLTITPACLFIFGKFPVISFLYNLCIPSAIGICLFLFFLSLPFSWIPGIGAFLVQANALFTDRILRIVQESPRCLDISLSLQNFPLPLLVLALTLVFLLPFLPLGKAREHQAFACPYQKTV